MKFRCRLVVLLIICNGLWLHLSKFELSRGGSAFWKGGRVVVRHWRCLLLLLWFCFEVSFVISCCQGNGLFFGFLKDVC